MIPTLLDPRLKDKFFSGPVKELLPDKCLRKGKNWVKQEKAGLLKNLLQSDYAPTCGKSFSEILEVAGTSPTDFRSEVDN